MSTPFREPLHMFAPHPDGTFTIEMSEWEMAGCPDPLTGERVYKWANYLKADWDARNAFESEIVSWSGILPSGAKVTVFND